MKICSDIYLEQQKGNNLQSETLNDDNVWAFLCTNDMNELQVNVCLESLHHKIGNYGPKLGAQHNPFLSDPCAHGVRSLGRPVTHSLRTRAF